MRTCLWRQLTCCARQATEAATVVGEGLGGVDDEVIAERLQSEGRALFTLDLGFGDIRTYPPQDYHGIIVVRSKRQDKRTLLALVRKFVQLLAIEPLAGNLWVVEADRVRIREGTTR